MKRTPDTLRAETTGWTVTWLNLSRKHACGQFKIFPALHTHASENDSKRTPSIDFGVTYPFN